MQVKRHHIVWGCFIFAAGFVFSCKEYGTKTPDTLARATVSTGNADAHTIITILDTSWGNVSFAARLLDYPDKRQDALLLIRNNTDTIRIDLYDAQNLLDPDSRPILVFSSAGSEAASFITLSDSLAVFAARTAGMARPDAFFLYLKPNGRMAKTSGDSADGFLGGQINYLAFFREKKLFMLHHSGVFERENGSDQFRSVCTITAQNHTFQTDSCYDIPLGDEDLFGSRNSMNYRDYYKMVYEKYVRKK